VRSSRFDLARSLTLRCDCMNIWAARRAVGFKPHARGGTKAEKCLRNQPNMPRTLSSIDMQAARAALSDFRRTHEPAALAEARDVLGPDRWEAVTEFEGGREGGFA